MSWYNPVSWFIDKENLEAGNAAAEKLKTLNEGAYSPGGSIYEQVYAQEGQQAAEDALGQMLENSQNQTLSYPEAESQVNEAFGSGWSDAYKQRLDSLGEVLAAPGEAVRRVIPWYWWLIGLVVLFVYLGGMPWLKKQLAKA